MLPTTKEFGDVYRIYFLYSILFYLYHRFNDGQRGEAYGETFGTGDVIGCGILYKRQELFFTKNGKYLGKELILSI